MQIFIAGSGKLATELLQGLTIGEDAVVRSWPPECISIRDKCIVVHAGSGRQLPPILDFCINTSSVLIELSTGSMLLQQRFDFPIVICPNTNILMLKFMNMLKNSGEIFREYEITLTESHQASKTSVPGTAVSMAADLGIDQGAIISVRNPETQLNELMIPAESLHRHAFHEVVIHDKACKVTLKTEVTGEAPYLDGVAKILAAVTRTPLENRRYDIAEFIDKRWI